MGNNESTSSGLSINFTPENCYINDTSHHILLHATSNEASCLCSHVLIAKWQ